MSYAKSIEKIIGRGYAPDSEEALRLYQETPLPLLMHVADSIRQQLHPGKNVSWMVDMNVNITNVCVVHCKFCNFCTGINSMDAYVLSDEEYLRKLEKLFAAGGNQLLIQGGLHPNLHLDFYTSLFTRLKKRFPELKLHALGPPEIVHLSRLGKLSFRETLVALMQSGLDSLPGAGAEILSNRVRKLISPAKCSAEEWLAVMSEAHQLGLSTSATMMFGHLESIEERIQHLIMLRDLQSKKPEGAAGFLAFIPWPFAMTNTRLLREHPSIQPVNASEYLRMIAISRIVLTNIPHIQASWLTVGPETAALSLRGGADDLGSVMIEENVVSAAGVQYTLDASAMKKLIESNGFVPLLRNQHYHYL
ncbi:MAG TPA: cyclic dehypoxanthinyl futalosine synthase [Bacteroidales bacterium]|nr:cyclic dehypoxanthinyl futalosine synthase [Bacteroidales bacterium]HQL69866.1 cyclic dehypoxanthinyl futalosine synthase [Bacteroidales bacterium]